MFLTHTNRGEASLFRRELGTSARGDQHRNNLTVVLQDLHRLLEDYAPGWYAYKHHRRSELGLQQQGHTEAQAFISLYNLLEEYAPRWYTNELREEARWAAEHLKKVAARPHDGRGKPTAYP